MSGGLFGRLSAGDTRADRVVPPSGTNGVLTLFCAAAMAFLAVFALALTQTAERVAEGWSRDLAVSATVQLPVTPESGDAQTGAALALLAETPGVASARALSAEEQAALLEPWFSGDVPMDSLPIPQLIEVIADDPAYDSAALGQRLSDEIPGAVLDDHSRWRAPQVDAARGLSRLGRIAMLLTVGVMAAVITLAVRAALAANAQVIEVLQLVGARDRFVVGTFVRRYTLRALIGAGSGMVLGVLAILLLPSGGEDGGFLTDLGFHGAGWLSPLIVPVLAAAVALATTWRAARKKLKELNG